MYKCTVMLELSGAERNEHKNSNKIGQKNASITKIFFELLLLTRKKRCTAVTATKAGV